MNFELYKLIPHDTKINFVGMRKFTYTFSIIMTLLSLLAFAFHGLNFGVDFKGGFLMEIRTQEVANIGELRDTLTKLDIGEVALQEFGSNKDVLIRIFLHHLKKLRHNKMLILKKLKQPLVIM